tara:strand:+ start:108 stop:725 length:618 start_codon:yes stop_codon:yes gene_type:complete
LINRADRHWVPDQRYARSGLTRKKKPVGVIPAAAKRRAGTHRAWRTFGIVVAFAGLSGCTTSNNHDMGDGYCDALLAWIDAGPREGTSTRSMKIGDGSDGLDSVVMWAMSSDAGCGDADCRDEADKDFTGGIAPMTHYWWVDEFASKGAVCLGGKPRIGDIDLMDDGALHHQSISRKGNASVTISWDRGDCGYQGCTTFHVKYEE